MTSFLLIIGAFYWGQTQLKDRSINDGNLLAERDASREKVLRLEKAQADTEDLDEITELLDTLLPNSKQQEKLIADIINTATSKAQIPFSKVSSFSFTGSSEPSDLSGTVPSEGNPGVYEYPFTLQINSITYETVLQLFKEIETNGRIVQVDNVQISPTSDGSNLVSINLSMKAYIRP